MQCPKCGKRRIQINALCSATVLIDFPQDESEEFDVVDTDVDYSTEWDGDSDCFCNACDWAGSVNQLDGHTPLEAVPQAHGFPADVHRAIGFQIAHHAREHAGQPVEIEQESEFGLIVRIPETGWEILLELDNDGRPVIRTYRPESQDEPLQTLVLTEGGDA